VYSENVDAYARVIKSAVEMTPGVALADLKVICADGILGGWTAQSIGYYGDLQTCPRITNIF
jgi:hypothetical protein